MDTFGSSVFEVNPTRLNSCVEQACRLNWNMLILYLQ